MPLDTQTFGITRHWLSVALDQLPAKPDIFIQKNLGVARKAFLAGSKQLIAIRNWLSRAEIVTVLRGSTELTELGRLMAAQDSHASHAWTWWLFHLHLCANVDSFPYSAFFLGSESDGQGWRRIEEIVEALATVAAQGGNAVEKATVSTYFEGVEQSIRPGKPIHGLGLVETREGNDADGKKRLRRSLTRPADIVVAYATTLFQRSFFPDQTTVEARILLEKGLARALGTRGEDLREALARISQHPTLSQIVQYRRQVNLDSVQFLKSGEGALRAIRTQAYSTQEVKWP